MLNQLKMWLVQRQRLDQIGPMSHMGPGLKKWLVQYLRLDQIGPISHMGPVQSLTLNLVQCGTWDWHTIGKFAAWSFKIWSPSYYEFVWTICK